MTRVRHAAFIAAGWVIFLAALTLFLSSTDNLQLRDHLRRSQFWFLEAQFALVLILTAANLPAYLRSLQLSRADVVSLAATGLLTLLLAGLVAPRTNRIYYDEQIYQGIGQNLADLRLAQMCNEGTVEYGTLQCWRGEYNKQPYGYPYLLSVVYRVAGTSYWTAPRFNVGCAVALVFVVFLTAFGLFEDPWTARFAALIMALVPEQLLWAHTAAAEPSAALMTALAVLTATYYKRSRQTAALAWMVVTTAFAMQFRTESSLAALIVALVLVTWAPAEFRKTRLWGWALVGLLLSTALIGHLVAIRSESWGASGDRVSLDFIAQNFRVNAPFYLVDSRFPAIYTMLAIGALALSRRGREVMVCATYFFLMWGVYLVFYAGSYNYGADVRFSVMTYPPLALLAGAGAGEVVKGLEGRGWASNRAAGLLLGALLFQFTWYLPLVRAVGEEAWAARADVAFSEQFVRELPANSFVLTHNPNVFHLLGVNAGQLSILTGEPDYVTRTLLARYRGGIYVHWNFWCNVLDPVQQAFCKDAIARFPTQLVREYKERDYRYAFYRVVEQPPPAP